MLLQAIQTQIALATDMEAIVRRVNGSPKYKKQTATLQGRLDAAKRAIKRCNGLYDSLYQSYVDQLMTEQEYMTLKRRYKAEAEEAERLIETLTRRQAAEAAHIKNSVHIWKGGKLTYENGNLSSHIQRGRGFENRRKGRI